MGYRKKGMTAGSMVIYLTYLSSQISARAYHMSQCDHGNGVGKKEAEKMFDSIYFWLDEFKATYESRKDQKNNEEAS
jgi:hypothetical protein